MTYRVILSPKGIKAKTKPIKSTTRKKKLELEARNGRVEGLQVCIRLICRYKMRSQSWDHKINH